MTKSHPLHQPINAPKLGTFTRSFTPIVELAAVPAVTSPCPSPTIDLKVLVIASDGQEVDLPAIKQALEYLGTPYTVYVASQTPNGLTPDKLSNGCHGFYQGIILTTGTLSYFNGTDWVSALSQQEWTNLWNYEATMGVRELSWYTYPTADFGYQSPNGEVDTSITPLPMNLTAQGQAAYPYLNATNAVTIQNAYTYLAQPLTDGATVPLFSDSNGNALVAVSTYPDGRQALSMTFDSNPSLIHSIVLSYGLINWLTNGLFLGERHIYMSPQIDDVFIDDTVWLPITPCGTPVDNTGTTYRITGDDLQAVINWQAGKRSDPASANLTLTMAFNGYGATTDAYTPDTLTPLATANQNQFYWVSHTYDHTNLDNLDSADATTEITLNDQIATTLGLTNFSVQNMVTPDVSGLTNANFLVAAYDNGIRYLVSDTSLPGYNNPSPNAGIYNTLEPEILMLPRYPNNLFYNVSAPDEWVAEYNCLYSGFWGRNLTYQEILGKESQFLVTYMLKGDLDPWMFHQPNLRAYDGTHTLLSDLLDLTLQKYAQYYTLPIISPTMDSLGQNVANWMQYNNAGVTASLIPGVSITIAAQKGALVPVTGLNTAGAEIYGGQPISYINLTAGQSVTLPLT
ncbi:MAG: hypothetical protein E6I80_15305 [Chloroflexi bacterium]|nr:MAG: hypothetical protein E6I80_15305 [Chloroflexota bacterium]